MRRRHPAHLHPERDDVPAQLAVVFNDGTAQLAATRSVVSGCGSYGGFEKPAASGTSTISAGSLVASATYTATASAGNGCVGSAQIFASHATSAG
jgi:hypothetical protein